MFYAASKVVKRMDGYKVRKYSRESEKKVLLPISSGQSSLTLLHLLDQQIRTQLERTGHQGYTLHVLHIDYSAIGQSSIDSESLRRRYPLHSYHQSMIEEALIFNLPICRDDSEQNSLMPDPAKVPLMVESAEPLKCLLSSLSSPSSRTDILSILRTQLITAMSQRLGCETIVWGSSATRLAEITLAETAKGRGLSLPLQINDRSSPHGITSLFPMRDLLRKEIGIYSRLASPPLISLLDSASPEIKTSVSGKGLVTIDELMVQYFSSVEENYPSIVANVVRTCNKLTEPSISARDVPCKVCNLPIAEGRAGLYGWGGDTSDSDSTVKNLCYGCTRSIQIPNRGGQ